MEKLWSTLSYRNGARAAMVASVVGETPAVPESLRGFRVWEEAWSSRSRPGGGAHTHRPSRPGRRAPGSNLDRIKQRGRRGTTTPLFFL